MFDVFLPKYDFSNFKKYKNNIEKSSIETILIILFYCFLVFGIGVGNFGTGLRHRAKFVIALIILASPFCQGLFFLKKKEINIKNEYSEHLFKNMKILHIITSLNCCTEHTLYKICKYDKQNRHTVISLKSSDKYVPLCNKLGIRVYCLNMKNLLIFINFFI